jgi:hypothetical protein
MASLFCLCSIHLMPRQPAHVEVLPLDPPEYIDVLEDSGLTSQFEIFLDGTGNQRVWCDRCGLFISVTSRGHPILFTKHRDSDECKKEVQRNAKKLANDAAQASATENSEMQHYTNLNVSTPITNTSILNLTPRQSHINLRLLPTLYPDANELPVASSAPQSPGSKFDELLSQSLEGVHITSYDFADSENDDGGGENSDGDDLDERGYLKVPEDDVCMGLVVQWIAGSLWNSYAYQEHKDDTLGWKPIAFD